MDELARRYILLGLRLERISPGFVDSYVGPPELAEAVAAEPLPIPEELHVEAVGLRAVAAELPDGDPVAVRRRRWFEGQLGAISALARRAGGEEIAYLRLVEELYGMPIAPVPEADLRAARERLDAALPGSGPLADRVQALRVALGVPGDRVLPAIIGSAGRFREITRATFGLPEPEGIDWEETHDQPWGAYAEYRGGGRTWIRINVDLPVEVPGIAYLASHEAYPGHHAEHVTKEHSLVQQGVGEAALRTMNGPEAMLAEGLADVAREVVMTDEQLAEELARIGSELGLEADWRAAVALHAAGLELAAAMGNASIMVHHEGRPLDEVRRWLEEVSISDSRRLEHILRLIKHPVQRTYAFTYTEGARLIRRWLGETGPTAGFARLLSEQLSPAQLLAEVEEPALYPPGFP
jgi:hypothetical protein